MRKLFLNYKILHTRQIKKSAHSWSWVLVIVSVLGLQDCGYHAIEEPLEYRNATETALAWNRLVVELERHTVGYRPPVSGRMFAYVEMAAYEASLPGLRDYVSLEAYVSGYEKSTTKFEDGHFYLPASLNAAYAQILRHFFATAPANLQQKIEILEKQLSQSFRPKINSVQTGPSEDFGKLVADRVWTWSQTDREGHQGDLYNYDHDYEPPVCQGCWQPFGEHPSPALLPYWGQVRPFVADIARFTFKNPVEYDQAPGSSFYSEAMEVYSVSKPRTKENLWIAEYWSDDFSGLTLTPAGRWISIANQALGKARPPFSTVMETYLKTGLALCDAGIVVWKCKYKFNVERPETYIRQRINSEWKALHDTPSFPAYPSGHAAFGAAVAEVLSSALGDQFQLTDRTHEHRPEFASTPRSYGSFAEMAQENAASRVLLGVHYRMDCEEGLRLGKIIGQKVVNLPLLRREAALLINK